MTLSKFLTIFSLTASLTICSIVGLSNTKQVQAQSNSRNDLVFVGIVRNNEGRLYRFNKGQATSAGKARWDTCPSGTQLVGRDFQPNGFWLCASPNLANRGTWYFGNVVADTGFYWELANGQAKAAGSVTWDTCWEGTLRGRLFSSNGFWVCQP